MLSVDENFVSFAFECDIRFLAKMKNEKVALLLIQLQFDKRVVGL